MEQEVCNAMEQCRRRRGQGYRERAKSLQREVGKGMEQCRRRRGQKTILKIKVRTPIKQALIYGEICLEILKKYQKILKQASQTCLGDAKNMSD